ncbi:MAG: hypothetical protein ACYDC2_12775, partial [Solirubrobacteraceae bacterium]
MSAAEHFSDAGTRRRRGGVLVTAALGCLLATALAMPGAAQASKLKEEFAPFVHCPVEAAAVCVVGDTTSGEFVMGNKTVPISKPIALQGGLPQGQLETVSLIAPRGGVEALSKVPLEIPGGLLGIANIGGEVTATAEIAGPVSAVKINQFELLAQQGTAVVLP